MVLRENPPRYWHRFLGLLFDMQPLERNHCRLLVLFVPRPKCLSVSVFVCVCQSFCVWVSVLMFIQMDGCLSSACLYDCTSTLASVDIVKPFSSSVSIAFPSRGFEC